MSVCSARVMRVLSLDQSSASKRQSSTFVACSENSAKFTPTPVQVAPSGYGSPGHTLTHGRGSCFVPQLGTGGSGLEAGVGGRDWRLGPRLLCALCAVIRRRQQSRNRSKMNDVAEKPE